MLNLRYKEKTNAWPGFVDLFSNLVIILIFLLIVFVFLWTTTSVFNKKSGIQTVSKLRQTNAEQTALIQQMERDEREAKRLLLLAREELNSNESSFADLSNAYEIKLQDLESQTAQLRTQIQELQNTRNLTTQISIKTTGTKTQTTTHKKPKINTII